MTIHVTSTDIIGRSFKDATGWHVDDRGFLHVTKAGDGNLATFHPGSWESVVRSDPVDITAEANALAGITRNG